MKKATHEFTFWKLIYHSIMCKFFEICIEICISNILPVEYLLDT